MKRSKVGNLDPQQRVRDAVLVHLAEALGPKLDQIDVVDAAEGRTRDVVAAGVEAKIGSPAELRVALLELVEAGFVGAEVSTDLLEPTSSVRLRPRGLIAARALRPGAGVASVSRLVLRLSGGPSQFDGRLAPIVDGKERRMKDSGVLLACFYVFAVFRPSRQQPITLAKLREEMAELAALGVGPKRGRGDRVNTSDDSIRGALELLRSPLRLASEAHDADRRRDVWFLENEFPVVDVQAPKAARDRRDWTLLLQALHRALSERRSLTQHRQAACTTACDAQLDERAQLRTSAGAGAEPQ